MDEYREALRAYAAPFFRTPVFSHLPYAVVALVLAVVFLFRSREPADAVVGVMLAATLVFAQLFGRDYGLINTILDAVGFSRIDWQNGTWTSQAAISSSGPGV